MCPRDAPQNLAVDTHLLENQNPTHVLSVDGHPEDSVDVSSEGLRKPYCGRSVPVVVSQLAHVARLDLLPPWRVGGSLCPVQFADSENLFCADCAHS